MKRTIAALAIAFAISGCGGTSDETSETQSPETSAPAASETTEPAPGPTLALPEGYPKVVKVSSLPDQVKSWYEMSDFTEAVAIAEGVWTPLPPGADVESAVASGSFDGFCASIKAFERDYLDGQEVGGTCW